MRPMMPLRNWVILRNRNILCPYMEGRANRLNR